MCAKFQTEIFRGYDCTVEFSIFPIGFEWALQQCSATALPVIIQFAGFLCVLDYINNYLCLFFHLIY